jgi:hypothetical protein
LLKVSSLWPGLDLQVEHFAAAEDCLWFICRRRRKGSWELVGGRRRRAASDLLALAEAKAGLPIVLNE